MNVTQAFFDRELYIDGLGPGASAKRVSCVAVTDSITMTLNVSSGWLTIVSNGKTTMVSPHEIATVFMP